MASNLFVSDVCASTMLAAMAAQLNAGFIDCYASTQPANANTNTSASNYLLSENAFSTIAFAVSTTGGTMTANGITNTTATSTGICVFYRAISSSRVAIIDGSVSTAAADMNFNSNNFAQGVSVAITSYAITFTEH